LRSQREVRVRWCRDDRQVDIEPVDRRQQLWFRPSFVDKSPRLHVEVQIDQSSQPDQPVTMPRQ